MAIEIKVPTLGESVTEATVGQWFKQQGEEVKADEPLVELETDKVTQEIYAPASGVLGEIVVQQGETVGIGAILASLNDGATGGETTTKSQSENPGSASTAAPAASAAVAPAPANDTAPAGNGSGSEMPPSPAARKALAESGQSASDVEGSGRRGQVLKHDVAAAQSSQPQQQSEAPEYSAPAAYVPANIPTPAQNLRVPSSEVDSAREERVRMSRLRQTVARRLKDAQNTAAVLTTFNDVDMTAVMDMRKQYKDLFEKRHGVKLGFMGFFVKACIQALREIPAVNAEIDGTDIIYKNYYHIGVAVGSDKGLVVPVVRNAEAMSIAEIEATIGEYGKRARSGQLSIEDMQGGTFTISNGGVYGSLMSTPILNAPQSGILGMHRIEQRPVVLPDGSIAARPMMYLALSYDHRLVDGKEAVTFLVRVKECLEDPHRFVLDL